MTELINLNTAQTEELTSLPGVGPVMAERIIAARPYEKMEDITRISGIGDWLVERLKPFAMVAALEDVRQDDENIIYLGAETESIEAEEVFTPDLIDEIPSEDEALPAWDGSEPEQSTLSQKAKIPEKVLSQEKAIIPVVKEEATEKKAGKQPKTPTWNQTLLIAGVGSLIAFFLAVLLTLGILGSLNNGLRYASTKQVQGLSLQVEALDTEIGLLVEDIESLRTRLDNLESLSRKVGELELSVEEITTDLANSLETIEKIQAQMAEFAANAERFQTFLDGLGELLDALAK